MNGKYTKYREYYKLYARCWRARNKEHLKEYRRRLYVKHRGDRPVKIGKPWKERRKELSKDPVYMARIAEYERKRRRAIRAEVIVAYGGKCSCCGEATPEFLAIDHINGRDKGPRGHGDNKLGFQMYFWLRKNGFPKNNYRLLCSNCNNSRGWFGYCPHERLGSS